MAKKCRYCRGIIFKWRTKTGVEGLSGETCKCQASHTIDQYSHYSKTKLRREKVK